MVVAGTPRDWDELDERAWSGLATALGQVVADAGGAWLTLRAYEAGGGDDERRGAVVDAVSDGRERFAEAMRHLPPAAVVDEKAVTGVLYEPADVEPDLVLVLGPPTRLPPSLVWELAYSELVFSPIAFGDLRPEHLQQAVDDFHGRRRRFGGLDT